MPSGRAFLIAFWVTFLGLGGYTLIGSAVHYFEMQELVDAVLTESSQKQRVISAIQGPIDGPQLASQIRTGILERARRTGLVLEDDRVIVTWSDQGITVAVNWARPALAVAGQSIISLPMSLERNFEARPAR